MRQVNHILIPANVNDSMKIKAIEIENTNFKSLNLKEGHIEEILRKNIEVIFEEETLLVVGKQVVNKNLRSM
jgi:23S rRNA-/tRNA-specific pseudouridylate synthase